MPTYGKVKVNTITYDASGTATDVDVANIATKASPTFTGTVTVPTPTAGDNSTKAASTAFVVASFAPKANPAFTGTATGVNLTLSGDLTVQGTTTTIDTTNLDVKDKNITLGDVSTPSDTTADGGGITLLGSTNKEIKWVDASDSWQFNQHIKVLDNKVIQLGDDNDFFLKHDNTNAIIQNGTGELQIKNTANSALKLYTNNTERFRFGGSGQLGIGGATYGSAGDVLTSGGSGAAPTWTAPAAGGSSFQAVANGSIANNKAVKLDSDGKVSQMAIAINEVSNGSGSNSSGFDYEWVSTIDSSGGYYTKVAWDTANNRILYVWQDQGDNWKPRYQLGYFYSSNTRISFGNADYIINSANSDYWEVAFDPNRNKFLATCGKDYTSSPTRQGRSYVGTVNTSNTSVSWSQTGTWRSAVGESRGYLAYMNTPQRWVVLWRGVSSPYSIMVREGTMSSSGSMTWGNTATITTSATNSGAMDMAYDSTTDRLVVIYADDNSPNHGFMKIGRCDSSGNWSFGSQITFNTTHTKNSKITCANGKAYIVFANGSDSDRWVNITGTLSSSANTITLGSTQSGPGNNKLGSSRHNLIYSDVIDKVIVSWTDTPSSQSPSNSDDWKIIKGSVSGNSISWESSSTYTLNGDCGTGIELGSITGSGFDDQGVLVVAGTQPSYSNKNDMYLFHTAIPTPNLSNYYQYVGFADQAYTNGQTATIKTYGSVVDTLSGLTIGSEYYIQADGTVGTSWDSANFPGFASNTPFAGLAIGTTKLLLRDPNARN